MEIKVIIHRIYSNPCSNIKAIASISLNGEFAIHGFKVMENINGGRFVAMPSAKNAQGKYYDVFHPLSKEMRLNLTEQIMDEYKRRLNTQTKGDCSVISEQETIPEQLDMNDMDINQYKEDEEVSL